MRRIILVLFLLISPFLFAQTLSQWEGSTALGRYGEFPASGFFGASNAFPRNTTVRVENLTNGKVVEIIIVSRLQDPGLFLLVSRDAASALGISESEIVRCRVTLNSQANKGAINPAEERAYTPDPDLNPKAGLSSELAFLDSILFPERAVSPPVQPAEETTPVTPVSPPVKEEPQVQAVVEEKPPVQAVTKEKPVEEAKRETEPVVEETPLVAELPETPPEEPDLPRVDDLILLKAEPETVLPAEVVFPEPEPQALLVEEPVEEPAAEVAEEPAEPAEEIVEEPALETSEEIVSEPPAEESVLPVVGEEPLPEQAVTELPLAEPSAEEAILVEPLPEPVEEELEEETVEDLPLVAEYPEAFEPEPEVMELEEILPPPVPVVEKEELPMAVSSREEMPEEDLSPFDLEEPLTEEPEVVLETSEEEKEVLEAVEPEPEVLVEETAEEREISMEMETEPPVEEEILEPVMVEEEKKTEETTIREVEKEEIPVEAELVFLFEPAEERPPEVPQEEGAEEIPEEVSPDYAELEVSEVTEVPEEIPEVSLPALEKESPLPVLMVNREAYYLQIGVFTERDSALKLVERFGSVYPLGISKRETPERTVYRVLVGPLNWDESGVVLLSMKNLGFKDAFLRRGLTLE